jgi:rRNA-processing protein FCF1
LTIIVWDTSILIKISNDPLPKVDLRALSKENEFVIIPEVLREILGLTASKNRTTARRAQMVLRAVEESKLFKRVVSNSKRPARETDEVLVEFVKEKPEERILATMDGALLSRMEKSGLSYMTLSEGRLYSRPIARATYLIKRRK